eukprot:752988-Hanusia_phi.AAC.2
MIDLPCPHDEARLGRPGPERLAESVGPRIAIFLLCRFDSATRSTVYLCPFVMKLGDSDHDSRQPGGRTVHGHDDRSIAAEREQGGAVDDNGEITVTVTVSRRGRALLRQPSSSDEHKAEPLPGPGRTRSSVHSEALSTVTRNRRAAGTREKKKKGDEGMIGKSKHRTMQQLMRGVIRRKEFRLHQVRRDREERERGRKARTAGEGGKK